MRPDTTLDVLATLPPAFKKDGTVTAGNASGIVDGGATLILASRAAVDRHGLKPIGRLVDWAATGVEPSLMGMGPAPATRKALQRAGLSLGDIDLIEVNEAFAGQYLAVEKELGLDRDRANVIGGAIAQACATSGYKTIVREVDETLLQNGLGRIRKFLEDGVAKGKVTAAARDTARGNLSGTTTFEALKDCDLVVEAIVENLDDKCQ